MSDLLWLLVHLKRQPNGHLEVWKTKWMPKWHARIADSRIRSVYSNKFTAEAYGCTPLRALRNLSRTIQQAEGGGK